MKLFIVSRRLSSFVKLIACLSIFSCSVLFLVSKRNERGISGKSVQKTYRITENDFASSVNILQQVNTHDKLLMAVVSAFRDPRTPSVIRILAIGHYKLFSRKIFCHFPTKRNKTVTTEATAKSPILGWSIDYRGHLIICPLQNETKDSSSVSISFEKHIIEPNKLEIRAIPSHPPTEPTIVSCVCPMFGYYYSEGHIITWLEWNLMLGVRHFTFYNHSMSKLYDPVFRYYIGQGIVTVIQWHTSPLPTSLKTLWPAHPHKIHYAGQVEANNECLNRWANRYRYIMFTDLDEMIIPLTHYQIDDLLREVDTPEKNASAFSFRATYLRNDFPTEKTTAQNPLVKKWSIRLLKRTVVEDRVMPFYTKNKLIVKSDKVRKIAVHKVDQTWNKKNVVVISEKQGLLFHYSNPDKPSKLQGFRDVRLVNYLSKVTKRTRQIIDAIQLR